MGRDEPAGEEVLLENTAVKTRRDWSRGWKEGWKSPLEKP